MIYLICVIYLPNLDRDLDRDLPDLDRDLPDLDRDLPDLCDLST